MFTSKVNVFKDDWCCFASKLKEIFLFPHLTSNLKNLNNEFIIGKSLSQSDEYDVLYFADREIKKAFIPSFITKITSYAFYNCMKLEYIRISINSNLQIIESHGFYNSSIESI